MTLYVTIPGTKKQEVIVPDNGTVADFARAVYDLTGCSLFNGFGYKSGNGSSANVPLESAVTNSNLVDGRTKGAVSLANTSYSTGLSTLFQNGDEVFVFNDPIGG